MTAEHVVYFDKLIQRKLEQLPRTIEGKAPVEVLNEICQELRILKDAREAFRQTTFKTKNEMKKEMEHKNPLTNPAEHTLQELFAELKFGRPSASQEYLDKCITELNEQEAIKTIAQQLGVKNFPFVINDKNGNEIYFEDSNGYWVKRGFDSNGNEIYFEDSNGYWVKKGFDSNRNRIYSEYSGGSWLKREFDENGNEIYWENSNGDWHRKEYDSYGNEKHFENSKGFIENRGPKDGVAEINTTKEMEHIIETTPKEVLKKGWDDVVKEYGTNTHDKILSMTDDFIQSNRKDGEIYSHYHYDMMADFALHILETFNTKEK